MDKTLSLENAERPSPHLHVLQVSRVGYLGGAERVLLTLAEGLVMEGHKVSVACPPEGGLIELARARGAHGMPCAFSRMSAVYNPLALFSYVTAWRKCTKQLTKYCENERVDLIHAHHPVGVLYSIPAALRLGIPIIQHAHDALPTNPLYALALWISSRFVSSFISVSSAATELLASVGVRDERVREIPNGVDWSFLNGAAPAARVSSPGPHVGVFGVLEPRKGQDLFIGAAKLVLEEFPTAKFWIVGGPWLKEKGEYVRLLETAARETKFKDSIELVGHQADVAAWMAAMDVVALTSVSHESVGMVLVEAMTLGRPTVSTRIGTTEKVIVEGASGFLADSNDETGIAAAILRVLRANRQEMGSYAASDMRARFSPAQFCQSVLERYSHITRSPTGR